MSKKRTRPACTECGNPFETSDPSDTLCRDCWTVATQGKIPTRQEKNPPTGDPKPTAEAPRVSRRGSEVKQTAGKLRWDLLPGDCLEALIRVYEVGVEKYWRESWREGISYNDLWAAAQRHLWAWKRGEDLNPGPGPEEGLEHLAQAAWGCLTLLWMRWHRPDLDDRWRPANQAPPLGPPPAFVHNCEACGQEASRLYAGLWLCQAYRRLPACMLDSGCVRLASSCARRNGGQHLKA